MMEKQQLQSFHLALSREADHHYVMDLIQRDVVFFLDLLQKGGIIMICGSLAMQKDVETILDELLAQTNSSISDYKTKGQILTDCY